MTMRGFLVFLGIAGICAGISATFFAVYMHEESAHLQARAAVAEASRA